MSELRKILDELEQKPEVRPQGHMFGTVTIDGQVSQFTADHVYAHEQLDTLRFFGRQTDANDPEAFSVLLVQLQPRTITSGTYKVGGPHVVDISYWDTKTGVVFITDQGEVALNRSNTLERLFGVIDIQGSINGELALIRAQYDIRGWHVK
ncbi:hypothetical protein ACX0KY_14755 [Pseudomonas extremorientalis]